MFNRRYESYLTETEMLEKKVDILRSNKKKLINLKDKFRKNEPCLQK